MPLTADYVKNLSRTPGGAELLAAVLSDHELENDGQEHVLRIKRTGEPFLTIVCVGPHFFDVHFDDTYRTGLDPEDPMGYETIQRDTELPNNPLDSINAQEWIRLMPRMKKSVDRWLARRQRLRRGESQAPQT